MTARGPGAGGLHLCSDSPANGKKDQDRDNTPTTILSVFLSTLVLWLTLAVPVCGIGQGRLLDTSSWALRTTSDFNNTIQMTPGYAFGTTSAGFPRTLGVSAGSHREKGIKGSGAGISPVPALFMDVMANWNDLMQEVVLDGHGDSNFVSSKAPASVLHDAGVALVDAEQREGRRDEAGTLRDALLQPGELQRLPERDLDAANISDRADMMALLDYHVAHIEDPKPSAENDSSAHGVTPASILADEDYSYRLRLLQRSFR